jgi:preprotein translocase subunit YajC
MQFAPIVLIFVLFFVLIIRPQQQREKKHKMMLDSIKKGDLIVTTGGLHGRVEGFGDDGKVLQVRIAEGVKVDILRSSVSFLKKGNELVEG